MATAEDQPLGIASLLDGINVRLNEAARTGAPVEVILSVRGRVEPVPGKHGERWRLRTGRGYVVSFRPEFVVAFNGTTHAHEGMTPPRRQTASTGLR